MIEFGSGYYLWKNGDQNSAKPNRASDHGEVSRGGGAREIFPARQQRRPNIAL